MLDDAIIDNDTFKKTGKVAEEIDYLGETITAIDQHVLPTPVFFEHLAEDFAYKNKNSEMRKIDACTLYDFAKYSKPGTLIPKEFTMEKRAEYLQEYRKNHEAFMAEMNALIEAMEETDRIRADYLRREQEKRDRDLAETMAILSEVQRQKEAEEIAREIEEDLMIAYFENNA